MHDHAEIELAAAAVDFELTAVERARLEKAIAECQVCASAAVGYRRQAALLTALPVVDASPRVRREVERAVGVRRQRTSWTWSLLAAGLVAVVAMSAVVGIGRFVQQRQLAQVEQTPTPTPSALPTPVATPQLPEPSADVLELDPPSGALATVGPPLPAGSAALVVTDNLRIRSAPFVGAASVKYRRLLQQGDRMYVLDGPVIGQNYEWYEVAVWRPSQPSIRWPAGWVARAGHDGEVWFQGTTVDCPASPMTIEALLALAPADRLACFGSAPIDIRAVVGTTSIDCDTAQAGCVTGPPWLVPTMLRANISAALAGSSGVPIAIAPGTSLRADSIVSGGVVQLHGTFDHPSAKTCVPDADRVGPDGPLAPIDAILACRLRFVVSAVTPETFPAVTAPTPGKTVSDHLRVRSLPGISDASVKYEPLLPLGTKLTVLDGPVLGNGYVWYHVTVAASDVRASTLDQPLTGWVAAAGLDGERWLKIQAAATTAGG